MFQTFDGWPHGWRKFRALLANLPDESPTFRALWGLDGPELRVVDGGRASMPTTTPAVSGRMSDEVWTALNKASGRDVPRGRIITLDSWRKEEPSEVPTKEVTT